MARPTNKQKRINQAQELLDNDYLQQIFTDLREDIRDKWQSCDDAERREACYYEVRALEDLKDGIYATAKDTIRE